MRWNDTLKMKITGVTRLQKIPLKRTNYNTGEKREKTFI